MRVAEPASGGVGLVDHDRIGHVDAFPARELRPETQIGIFVIEKEIRIEKSDLVEHRAAVEHSCAACAENALAIIEARALRGQAAIKADRRRRQPIAGAVDCSAAFEEQLGGADPHPRVFAHRLDDILQPAIIRLSIVIDERDEVPLGCF